MKKWITYQLYGEMTLQNCSSIWCIDHILAIASFNILDKKHMRRYFRWITLRPMYSSEINSKKDKVNHHLHLLQEIKAIYFLKLNDHEGLKEDIR